MNLHEMLSGDEGEPADPPGHDGYEEDGEEADEEVAQKEACKEILDAIRKNDEEALCEALKKAFPLFDEDEEDGESEPEGGGHAALLLMPHPHGGG